MTTSPELDHMWRRGARLIARSLRAYPGLHTIAMLGALGFVAASIGGAWLLGWMTDNLVVPAFEDEQLDGGQLVAVMGLVVVVSVGRGLGVMARRWFLSLAEHQTQRDWRRQLVEHYLDVPLKFHRTRPTGELLAHADLDLTAATMVLKPLAFSMSVVALVIVAVITLLLIHPLVAIVGLVLFPLLVIISQLYTARVEEPAALAQQSVGDVASVAHESFDGVLVVKTLGHEHAEVQRMAAVSDRLRRDRVAVGRIRAGFDPLIEALPNIGVISLLLVGSWLVSEGSATPGDLVLAAVVFGLLATPLRVFGFFLEELPKSVVAADRVDRVMAEPVEDRSGSVPLPAGPLGLSVTDLSTRLDGHSILHGVSLDIVPGTTTALVGATGSGKSTLLDSIAGLIEPADGDVFLGGVAQSSTSAAEWSAAVALAFQESFLFADSIRENVALGHDDEDLVVASLRTAQAAQFVGELPDGIDTVVGERGTTLSGGQRQRVALARALARRPRLLLLDDATSSVDAVVEAEILRALQRDLNTTLLLVAHRISTILLADTVVYFDEGRVVASGTHAELLGRTDYRALVTAYEQGDAA